MEPKDIDRMDSQHTSVFCEFLKVFGGLEKIPKKDTKYYRIFMLRLAKNVKDFKYGEITPMKSEI